MNSINTTIKKIKKFFSKPPTTEENIKYLDISVGDNGIDIHIAYRLFFAIMGGIKVLHHYLLRIFHL